MPAFPHSLCGIRFGDHAEQPSPVVARSEVERGIPRQRRTAADSLVAVPCTFLFKSKAEAAGFESWFFGEALAGGGWFDFTLPRTDQVVTAQMRNGDIGALKPRSPDWKWSERSVVLEYVRPGFRTLPPGLHSVTPAQVLQVQRASTATFVDSAGVLQTAAAHVARFTYFSGKNIYSGPVDLVAGPGAANVSHFLRTSAAGNPPALGFSEVVTISFQLYQDALSAAVAGRLARVLVEWRSIPSGTSGNALVDSVAISPGARQSITITMPTSAVADFDFRITLGKVGGASEGTITAANVMVERGAVATAYEPGARMLVEAAATNLLFPSEPTVAQVPTLSNVTNAAAQYPAFQRSLLFPANGTNSFAYLSRALDAGQQFVFSVFVKIAGVPVFTGGTAGSADGALTFGSNVLSVANVQHVGGDLWRIWVTGIGPGAGPSLGVVKYATNSAKQFWVMGYQLEAGAAATSYIATTTAPATRAADVIQVTA